ncbi:co-chaperone DjlA [Coxiella burnetii]|uniref:co-chaperone DjlA n=1 Tax=Coxiella burnetii TaxID=777 RepID=UPI0000ECFDB0|nr:co-chaperone DjlA [Coxiella burnetii]ACJ19490.1 mucoidy activation protein [Coxiella burnetii CbuK_Q154]PHH58050.1 co-chaperone DjlA [Coxiella burnetii]UYK69558.1 co-chaperone DjlA [Coxiella burnetii]
MMNWIGKLIGMMLGFILAGPIGLIIGLFIGHVVFDQGRFRQWFQTTASARSQPSKIQEVFFNTTFRVMGFVAKADGRVSENEIRQARQVMQQMNLDDSMKREAIRLFTEGKQPNFNLDESLNELRQACVFQPALLRVFLEIQIQMASADGQGLSGQKRQVLQTICRRLWVFGFDYNQFEQRFRAEQNYQRYQQRATQDPRAYLNDAYKVLGLTSAATDSEIKKSYRRLMSQHHPDKLMAKGLPPEMMKMATQKTQQIKKAYEQIRKARSMV